MILITGSNGFLGRYIINRLKNNHQLRTLNKTTGDYRVILENDIPLFRNPFSLVIHAAGKAHFIPRTKAECQCFYDINVTGTKNLLLGLEKVRPLKQFVFISSVAVYGKIKGKYITEDASLLAEDAYGESKKIAESLIQDWCKQNDVKCTILRLPLVVGDNPPGNLGNMINAIRNGYYFNIGRGEARKSMVMADDVARFILIAAEVGGIYNLTDGYHPNFSELANIIAQQLCKRKQLNIPFFLAKIIAYCGDIVGPILPFNSERLNKLTSSLTFDDSKAINKFGWKPTPVLSGLKDLL